MIFNLAERPQTEDFEVLDAPVADVPAAETPALADATSDKPVRPAVHDQLATLESLACTMGLVHPDGRDDGALHRARRASRAAELQGQVEHLIANMRIAVIHGGDKADEGAVLFPTHNPRSWKSYKSVAEDIAHSLQRLGCGHVTVMADDMRLVRQLEAEKIDFAWLNTGGVQGMGAVSHAAATLEMLGVPYVGHDPLNAAILDTKHVFKRQVAGMGIATAPFMTWHGSQGAFDPTNDPRFAAAFATWDGEYIVKPVSGRASLHVEHVADIADLARVAGEVFDATQNHVMVEGYLSGREYCIAAAGSVTASDGRIERRDEAFTFCAIERVLEADERVFTSMDKKAITAARIRHLDSSTDGLVMRRLHDLGRRVFEALELETLVRLDVRADAKGRLHVLEANPKPDLKAPTEDGVTSIVAEALAHQGMAYDDLILSLLADRIDTLFRKRRGSVNHLVDILAQVGR